MDAGQASQMTNWTDQLPVVAAVIFAVALFGMYLERQERRHAQERKDEASLERTARLQEREIQNDAFRSWADGWSKSWEDSHSRLAASIDKSSAACDATARAVSEQNAQVARLSERVERRTASG